MVWFINLSLCLSLRFRRQGVAQRLVREAESHARLWGFSELLLPVDPKNSNPNPNPTL